MRLKNIYTKFIMLMLELSIKLYGDDNFSSTVYPYNLTFKYPELTVHQLTL